MRMHLHMCVWIEHLRKSFSFNCNPSVWRAYKFNGVHMNVCALRALSAHMHEFRMEIRHLPKTKNIKQCV